MDIRPINTLTGHKGRVHWAEVYAKDQRILSASEDKTLKIWDAKDGRLLHTLEGHTSYIRHAAVSSDGKRAVSASADKTLKVWDLTEGKLLGTLRGHSHDIWHTAIYGDGQWAISASEDMTLKVWDLANFQLVHTLDGHTAKVWKVVVFAKDQLALSASNDHTLKIWDLSSGILIRTLGRHSDWISDVEVYARGERALSASEDHTLKVWELSSGRLLHTLKGHSGPVRHAEVFENDRRALSVSEDKTLKVWDIENGKLLYTLEGHTDVVRRAAVYANGERAISASNDRTLKVWDLKLGRLLHTLVGHSDSARRAVVFAHDQRALSTSWDHTLKLWNLGALDAIAPTEDSSLYINAKVVLVGDSGVGKSGLRLVLEGRPFAPTDSTHGRYVTLFERTEAPFGDDRMLHRETLLWDLAGQPGYRLVNQLSLDGVAIALVVFDAKSELDPFGGIRHWDRALRVAQKSQRTSGLPLKKFLVAARMDRGTIGVSRERIELLCKELGFEKQWFETSAKEDLNIVELAGAIRTGIEWGQLPSVVSTPLFQGMKEFLIKMKESQIVLEEERKLFDKYLDGWRKGVTFDQFRTCVDRLCAAGLIRRLAFGDLLLLQPEMLDSYASALVNSARQQPDGMGWIREDDALEGNFMPRTERVESPAQEKLLLIAMVKDLLAHEIALREQGKDGTMLIFPSQYTRQNPTMPDPAGKSIVLEFEGPVMSIYTTLAVRLAQSGTFTHEELWKNAVTYKPRAAAGQCGLVLTEVEEARGRLTVFHAAATEPPWRDLFEAFVDEHLHTHALPESVKRRRVVVCAGCRTPVSDDVAERRLARGHNFFNCPVCDERVWLYPVAAEPMTIQTTEELREMGRTADSNRELAEATAVLKGKIERKDFDVFLCYRTQDRPAVKRIGESLKKCGVLPWLDEWELNAGERWQEALQKQIKSIKSVAVFFGSMKLDRWQKIEVEGFVSEFVKRELPVIPVVLEDAKEDPEIPPFLVGFHGVDFRKTDPDPVVQLKRGIIGQKSNDW